MIAKNVVISGKGYVKVTLNKEETNEAMEELLKFNMKELERVIVATKNSNIMAINQAETIKLLFDKQAVSAYTFLQAKLDDKIDELRKKEQ